ncbi:MAG: hypothetical protein ACTSU5_04020 [Promethearchaeota archaeon]
MSVEETKIFDASNKSMQNLVQATEETLKELEMTVKTLELDKTLMESHGAGPLGKAIVTVYREANKAYIRLKHSLESSDEFWDIFSQYLSIFAASPEDIGERARIVQKIIDNIKSLGVFIPEQDAWDFIYKFLRKFKRNPDEEEVNQIAISYVEMLEQEQQELPHVGVDESQAAYGLESDYYEEGEPGEYGEEGEEEEVTPEQALRAVIREMDTLTSAEKNHYISILTDLTIEQQKMLVAKIQTVDQEMDQIPYLTVEEREALREQLMRLPRAKREKKISSIVKKRQKRAAYYQMQEETEILKRKLSSIDSLSDLEKEIYLTSISGMGIGEKERFVNKLILVEKMLDEVVSSGKPLNEVERKHHREELLRMDDKVEMDKYLKALDEEKKILMVTEQLLAEVPQLAFEEEKRKEKLIKELLWLSEDERKDRIEQLKKEIGESVKKRDELFSVSKAGNTCPECGWIVGKWSKRCPRCGHDLSGW